MKRVFVAGLGAVSPAGWGVGPLCEALERDQPVPVQPLARPGWPEPLRMRAVPNPAPPPKFLAHPRFRRSSPITHYAAAAALEAVAGLPSELLPKSRVGLIGCLQAGCVKYSRRFFEETLKDPTIASPLLFPETVYAGPASHVAALLGTVALTYTLVGDPSCFLQGVALAAQWLEEERVEVAVILGCEENDWILADALWHLDRSAVIAGGAGALCLCREARVPASVELAAITDPHPYSRRVTRTRAAQAMRRQLGAGAATELLCDGTAQSPRADAPERAAWQDWPGARLSPKRILGEGLMAGAAWQCVAACQAVASGRFTAANVSVVGSNQQALGARFVRAGAAHAESSPTIAALPV